MESFGGTDSLKRIMWVSRSGQQEGAVSSGAGLHRPGRRRSDGSGLGACQLDDPGQRSRAPSASYAWGSQVTALPCPELSGAPHRPRRTRTAESRLRCPPPPPDAGARTVRPAPTPAGTLSRRIVPGRRLPMLAKGLAQRRSAPDDGRRRTTAFRVRCLDGGVLFAVFRHQGETAHNRATPLTRSVMAVLSGQRPEVQKGFALRLQRARPTACARQHRLQGGPQTASPRSSRTAHFWPTASSSI